MEPELMALAMAGGPAAIITGMILLFLRPVRTAVIEVLKVYSTGTYKRENTDA
jgi:hypothetical protein